MTAYLANRLAKTFIAASLVLLLAACSVNVKKNADGEDHNVDIQTPVGGIHVSEDASASDIGLPIYPGAKENKEKDASGDKKNANVNISGPGFAVRVIAIDYVSTDPQQKVIDYYKDQLKKYGNVVQCNTGEHVGNVSVDKHGNEKDDNAPVTCEGDNNGKTVELKVGVKSNQHVVAVEPNGTGSSFALVYVRTRGKEAEI
jgi:hypothetical protein